MDHRGHGRSDSPDGVEAHRMGEYVADVEAVLDAAGAEEAAFVGYSAGATIGFRFAAAHPERCTALVAMGGFPEPDDGPPGSVAYAAEVRRTGTRSAIELLSSMEEEPAPEWLVDHLCTTEAEMFALLIEGWSDETNGWELLPRISCPSLIIIGAREADGDAARRSAARMPDGRAEVLPGFGHLQAFSTPTSPRR